MQSTIEETEHLLAAASTGKSKKERRKEKVARKIEAEKQESVSNGKAFRHLVQKLRDSCFCALRKLKKHVVECTVFTIVSQAK